MRPQIHSSPLFGRLARSLLFIYLLIAPRAYADYLTANRSVALKDGPSASSDPIGHVETGDNLALISTKLKGNYYHVKTATGQKGWIYKGFATYQSGTLPAPAPPAPTPGTPAPAPAGKLKIRVLNVGQGDAILITCPHGTHQMLIDTGDPRYTGATIAFQNAMKELQQKDDPIEVAIGTHPHFDHIGHMEWIVREYKVNLYVDDGMEYDSDCYRDLNTALQERGVHHERADAAGLNINFCPLSNLKTRVILPQHFGRSSDPNDNSVIVRIDYGQDSFLFVGDAEAEEEKDLLATPAAKSQLDCEFLKVGHHGSDTSSIKEFLDAVTPNVAVVSPGMPGVATNGRYKHPRTSTIERLLHYVQHKSGPARQLKTYDAAKKDWVSTSLTGDLYSTSLEGDLLVESDGQGISVRSGR